MIAGSGFMALRRYGQVFETFRIVGAALFVIDLNVRKARMATRAGERSG